ncbi:hypothetical protein BURMUCGD1_4372 [Burkholderia multivorans CGD1]|nr:hypothetical protein BURMUCGD1_4372 [Burkholderia multivorans CGD1]
MTRRSHRRNSGRRRGCRAMARGLQWLEAGGAFRRPPGVSR